MYNAEYPQPNARITSLRIPVVEGYITGRLRTDPHVINDNNPLLSCQLTIQNVGVADCSLDVLETDDISVSGARTVLATTNLVAGGVDSVTVVPTKEYLEFKSTTGTTAVNVQLQSVLRYAMESFSKSDTNYPQVLWSATYPNA